MIDEIKKLIEKVPVEYGDVRVEKTTSNGISYRRNTLENLSYTTNFGGCIRLYDGGNWVNGNFSGLNNFKKVLQWLTVNLRYMKNKDYELENFQKNYYTEEVTPKQRDLLKIRTIMHNETEKMKLKDYIKSFDFVFSDQNIEKYFISNNGSYIKQQFNSLGMSIKITGISNTSYVKTIRGVDEDKVIKDITQEITKGMQNITKKKLKLIEPRKNITVLLDPKIAGVLMHETIGHTLEADSLLMNKKLYNSILANPICYTANYSTPKKSNYFSLISI
ncbi:PmbA/TldA family metallopeptidase [Paramaledivibacter caminithermalis]|uniref:PmbA/TldA family metallopeptidase n=1 Tax=Paramaledivibacter caminithermalis TaxID=191027 RepID=UPI001F60F2B6|nr:DNA gyrase modulator [Paramaledivibacter caminithermalis]